MLPYVSQARQDYGLDVMIEAEKRQGSMQIRPMGSKAFEAGLSIESSLSKAYVKNSTILNTMLFYFCLSAAIKILCHN